jgi:molybdopterin molybdotransferase
VLAKDVFSNINIPGYDKTFIDGYAINPKDTEGASTTKPAVFKIVGKLFPADYPTNAKVASGEAIYVACGAPIPKGAASTVKVEETRLNRDKIEIVREIKSGEGIIPLGDDVKQGTLILKQGQVLRPQDIGLLASIGLAEAEVQKAKYLRSIGRRRTNQTMQKRPSKNRKQLRLSRCSLSFRIRRHGEAEGDNA